LRGEFQIQKEEDCPQIAQIDADKALCSAQIGPEVEGGNSNSKGRKLARRLRRLPQIKPNAVRRLGPKLRGEIHIQKEEDGPQMTQIAADKALCSTQIGPEVEVENSNSKGRRLPADCAD
jgi:hypothetical protein